MTSDFRVQKARAEAVLTLSNEATVRGYFFVSGSSATHTGPERIIDVLNAQPGFFPFDVRDAATTRTILFNRDHIVFVTLQGNDEARSDPGYDVATERRVSLLMGNGTRLSGLVRVYLPEGHDRLSDYTQQSHDQFRYLETQDATLIFNVRHVIEIMETRTP